MWVNDREEQKQIATAQIQLGARAKKKNQLWPIRGIEITFQGSPQTNQR